MVPESSTLGKTLSPIIFHNQIFRNINLKPNTILATLPESSTSGNIFFLLASFSPCPLYPIYPPVFHSFSYPSFFLYLSFFFLPFLFLPSVTSYNAQGEKDEYHTNLVFTTISSDIKIIGFFPGNGTFQSWRCIVDDK